MPPASFVLPISSALFSISATTVASSAIPATTLQSARPQVQVFVPLEEVLPSAKLLAQPVPLSTPPLSPPWEIPRLSSCDVQEAGPSAAH